MKNYSKSKYGMNTFYGAYGKRADAEEQNLREYNARRAAREAALREKQRLEDEDIQADEYMLRLGLR
jgi:hypothetical protein